MVAHGVTATSGTANVDGYVANVTAAAKGSAFAAAVIARVVIASVGVANVNGASADTGDAAPACSGAGTVVDASSAPLAFQILRLRRTTP